METNKVPEKIVVVFDPVLLRPGCVILQALGGGADTGTLFKLGMHSEYWLVSPSPDMRPMAGTEEEWKKVAVLMQQRHPSKRVKDERRQKAR